MIGPSMPPGPASADQALTAPQISRRAPATWRRHLRVAAGVTVACAVAMFAVLNRSSIGAGSSSLAGADLEWLAFALALATALWVAGTAAQLGAVPIRPPLTQLFAVQVAASIVNHVVPGSVGGMAVNVRYLQRAGMTRPAAVAAIGLNSVATLVTHLALIATLWALAPAVLPGGLLHKALTQLGGAASGRVPGGPRALLIPAGLVLVAVVAAGALLGRARLQAAWSRIRRGVAASAGHLRRELRALATVLRQPGRASLLWLGSAASPILHALILIAVYNSLSGGLSPLTVALVYLVASSVAALVPSPGGFGGLDVTLVAGMITVGAPSTTALAAVLGYRLITVWVPLVPGALVFAMLLRRKIL